MCCFLSCSLVFLKFQVCFLFSSFEVIRSSLEPYLVVLLVSDRRGLCPPVLAAGQGSHSKACVHAAGKPPDAGRREHAGQRLCL